MLQEKEILPSWHPSIAWHTPKMYHPEIISNIIASMHLLSHNYQMLSPELKKTKAHNCRAVMYIFKILCLLTLELSRDLCLSLVVIHCYFWSWSPYWWGSLGLVLSLVLPGCSQCSPGLMVHLELLSWIYHGFLRTHLLSILLFLLFPWAVHWKFLVHHVLGWMQAGSTFSLAGIRMNIN